MTNRPPVIDRVIVIDGEKCRYLPLTKGLYSIVDESKYDELSARKCFAVKACVNGFGEEVFYAATSINKKVVYLHTLLTGNDRTDHKNHSTLDNRMSNLRPCNASQSLMNRRKLPRNTTGFKGVYRKRGKFFVHIGLKGKIIYGGTFATAEEAALRYNELATRHFGEFAHLNVIPDQ